MLFGLEFCQKQRMAEPNLVLRKGFDHGESEFSQAQAGSHVSGAFVAFGCDKFERLLRFAKRQRPSIALEVSSNYTRTIG
jgi:hypothetical protein